MGETSVMDGQPVNVAIKPGWDTTKLMDAVPPIQTAASKTMMVKLLLKQDTKKSILSFLNFAKMNMVQNPNIKSWRYKQKSYHFWHENSNEIFLVIFKHCVTNPLFQNISPKNPD